jgi:plastocyanin
MTPWRMAFAFVVVLSVFGNAYAVQHNVSIVGIAFVPDSIIIDEGDTVVWTNNDGIISHTTTSDSGIWDSGTLNDGESFSFAFDSAGTFPYHCTIHPTMLGNIEVLPVVTPDVEVEVGDLYFSPAVIQIDSGEVVRWTNVSVTIHTSTAIGGLWDSGDLGQNDSFDYTFSLEGEYDYDCTYHPVAMTGTVIVGTPDTVAAEVAISEYAFDLDDITVPVGSYVRWINFGEIIHTVTDTSANYFDSGDLGPGDTFTLYADSVGDFYYLCNYHPTLMSGALHVTDTSSGGACDYVVGDVNGSDSYNGLDITFGVNYFKGGTDPFCPLGSCTISPCDAFFYCGDVNESCSYNGLDITYGVNYFKGGSDPSPCADCPPPPIISSE